MPNLAPYTIDPDSTTLLDITRTLTHLSTVKPKDTFIQSQVPKLLTTHEKLSRQSQVVHSLAPWSFSVTEDPEREFRWRQVDLQTRLSNGEELTESESKQLKELDKLVTQMSEFRQTATAVVDVTLVRRTDVGGTISHVNSINLIPPPAKVDDMQSSDWRFASFHEQTRRLRYHTEPWMTFLKEQQTLRDILNDQQEVQELLWDESLLSEAVINLHATAEFIVEKSNDCVDDFSDEDCDDMSNAIRSLSETLDSMRRLKQGNVRKLERVGKMILDEAETINEVLSRLMVVKKSSVRG
ncbi:hypothetical protein M231_03245 [Tremella mesenterica]|uniref:Uncharacterized protein n=1 Tax=Tremella mesenterica TaxID=5217 RepID=A0A4Q1BNV2_TREME|nr:hypothetical protein M231_03245 [Tremella mesenterica]